MSKFQMMVGPAVAVAFLALGATGAAKADGAVVMQPAKGLSFDVGAKRAVTYFKPAGGICNLTVLMSDRMGEDSAIPAASASRVTVAVFPAKTARIDTAEGKSLEFQCATGGQSMTVKALEQVAWTPRTTR